MSVVGKLFWNDDVISAINDDEEKKELKNKVVCLSDQLSANMDENNNELLEELLSTKNAVNCYDVEEAFCLGFKTAVRLFCAGRHGNYQ